jgi:hypothetical protein
MESKSAQIRHALSVGNVTKAISLASKFHDRSQDTKLFKLAQSAIINPSFFRQIGKDPDAIINEARLALISKMGP